MAEKRFMVQRFRLQLGVALVQLPKLGQAYPCPYGALRHHLHYCKFYMVKCFGTYLTIVER